MTDPNAEAETIAELRSSFFYGSRSNLNFKFLNDLSDAEFGDFLAQLLDGVGNTINDGDTNSVIDVARRWQVQAYTGHLGTREDFAHAYNDTPITPLSESRIGLLTSSGHFVDGDDPEPFGVKNMTQAEAEDRIIDFLANAPQLSSIPFDVNSADLHVRHGGYPVAAVAADHQVALPLNHLQTMAQNSQIGGVTERPTPRS